MIKSYHHLRHKAFEEERLIKAKEPSEINKQIK